MTKKPMITTTPVAAADDLADKRDKRKDERDWKTERRKGRAAENVADSEVPTTAAMAKNASH